MRLYLTVLGTATASHALRSDVFSPVGPNVWAEQHPDVRLLQVTLALLLLSSKHSLQNLALL